ncbi:MAG: dynamin family protein [Bacillaceae bacterium]|nr:dynamin family protein [Bacillaceae bacterium]
MAKGEAIKTINEKVAIFETLVNKYKPYQDFIHNDLIDEINQFAIRFKDDASQMLEMNRKLKIGIVGQVKAGKSSFLNALLFNGKSILPKAATPMTAALTVISYGKEPKAKIEFYSEEEWQVIEEKAHTYVKVVQEASTRVSFPTKLKVNNRRKELPDKSKKKNTHIPSDIEAAYELVQMFRSNSTSLQSLLGKEKVLSGFNETEEMIGQLNDYVGANGTFTPIVKSSTLFIPNEVLKEIDVVDTPGVNDPIISRGQKTREHLGKCDVIFLLSYAAQFMDTTDVELVTQNIPDKGIKDIVLVGSKFDSVLMDEGDRYPSLRHALKGITDKLNIQAERTILPVVSRYRDNEMLQSLRQSLPPIFISSYAYNLSNQEDASQEELHVLKELKNTFRDDELTKELLLDVSNIEYLRNEKLTQVQKNKDDIVKNRFQQLCYAQENAFKRTMKQLHQELSKDLERVEQTSENELDRQYKMLVRNMNNARNKVDLVFDNQITRMKKEFSQLYTHFKKISQGYKRVEENTERKRVKVGTERYGFLWLKKRDVFETQTFVYANVLQVIDKIEDLTLKIEIELKNDFNEIIQMELLTNQLKNAILDVFDLGDEGFDFEDIVIPVHKAVNKISVPTFELDGDKYKKDITKKFGSGMVEGGAINRLKEKQFEVIEAILKDVQEEMKMKIEEVASCFEQANQGFISDVLQEAEEKTTHLKEQIVNRAESITSYKQLLDQLSEDISLLDNIKVPVSS